MSEGKGVDPASAVGAHFEMYERRSKRVQRTLENIWQGRKVKEERKKDTKKEERKEGRKG